MLAQISNLTQIASVRRSRITSGVGAGLDIIDCDNGKIRFILNESKALDVMQLYHEGQNMSFVSKNGFTTKDGEFLSRFEGGMVYTCGLDGIGEREGIEVHGSFHNNKAEVFRAECNEKEIVVEAYIYNTALCGRNLKMHRKIWSALGSATLTIEDKLINEGFGEEKYCLLYHVNIGYPMLDVGARVEAEVSGVESRTPFSLAKVSARPYASQPIALADETCYFLDMVKPEASLINKKIGKKFTVRYSKETLPHFVHWSNMVSGDYAMGLEPATSTLDGDFEYSTVGAGKTVDFRLELSVEKI